MSFYDVYNKWRGFDFDTFFAAVAERDIFALLSQEAIHEREYLALLSQGARSCLEKIAQKSQRITQQYFGRTIGLYTPMYLSDYCVNECRYCGFRSSNKISRRKLSLEEVEKEAQAIYSSGFRHILVLTGESRKDSPPEYIKECVRRLKKYFSLISIEVYPLTADEYQDLITAGVDGLTLYQEVYDENAYTAVHVSGPKKDYAFRLDAPERAAQQGMCVVNIGALLGLANWRTEAFFTGLHARYLQDCYPGCEISISIPRLRQANMLFKNPEIVTHENIVQIITSLRLFLPRAGITLSTREAVNFRDNLIPLGITRMSAASSTVVGGHSCASINNETLAQFEIADTRTLAELKQALLAKGYQPVMKDWVRV